MRHQAVAWVTAARPLSLTNVLLPVLLGQAYAYNQTRAFSWFLCGALVIYAVLDQWFIVFANDYADREDDSLDERTMFSGGSGVIQNAQLTPESLRCAAMVTGGALLALGTALAFRSWLALPLTLAALALVQLYSYKPARLSYRGGGEWLQGVGMGFVLPAMGAVVQARGEVEVCWPAIAGLVVLAAAGNIATSLPDFDNDRRVNKRSVAVRYGVRRASYLCVGGMCVSAALLTTFAGTNSALVGVQVFLLMLAAGVTTKGAKRLFLVWVYGFFFVATHVGYVLFLIQ